MSVITSVTAVPNRMTIVWALLVERGKEGIVAEELASLVRPVALQRRQGDGSEPGSAVMFNEVITEMQNLGIITRTREGLVTLTPEAPTRDSSSLIEYIERILLDPESAVEHGQRSFAEAMAWFLTRDPYRPLPWKGGYKGQVSEDCGEDTGAFDLTDEARSQQFVYWAVYLGFAWRLSVPSQEAVFPDPTAVLARNLPSIILSKDPLPIAELMASVAERFPVFEGGRAREKIESLLPANLRRHERQLSRSTSLALERLEVKGLLSMERVADAPAFNLDSGSRPRPVSHVTWLEKK